MLLILTLGSSFVVGVIIFMLGEERAMARTFANIGIALFKVLLTIIMLVGVYNGQNFSVRYELLPGVDFSLEANPLALLFSSLSAFLWLLTTIYAVGYLENSPNRSRFFGFFAWCVCATTGVAFAGNLITFLIFYEMLTLTTYPLVVHRGTKDSIRAGGVYLRYTFVGGALLLGAVVWIRSIVGSVDFQVGGILSEVDPSMEPQLIIIFALLVAGFGVKAAIFPLHGWLPRAMVAPAPVSALLHAVAVVKAGAFGIVRTIYDVYGINYANALGVLVPLAIVVSITIIFGSVRALFQDDLKKRLAFSTVSQVSYIALGASIFGPLATIGGLVHIVHQALMKITLFFAAGNLAETLHIHKVSEMNGVARRMPWTMAAFTVGAIGMIGMPPMAGFVSKWYLAQGALANGSYWIVGVLIGSAVLNAAYFFPIIYAAWFKEPNEDIWKDEGSAGRFECSLSLLTPPVVTAALTILVGLFAGMAISPLEWARLIAELEYR